MEQGGAPAPDDQLFDRSVFKVALPTVSNARLNQFLYAEYANQRPFVAKLENQKAEQTPDNLADLWGLSKEAAISKAKELVEIGFFVERGTREAPTYWVPFLYRDALHLVQGKAEGDQEAEKTETTSQNLDFPDRYWDAPNYRWRYETAHCRDCVRSGNLAMFAAMRPASGGAKRP